MDNIRLILLFALAFVSLLLYQAWVQDYGPVSLPSLTSVTSNQQGVETPSSASQPVPSVGELEVPPAPAAAQQASPLATPSGEDSKVLADATRIHVQTDLLKLEIDTRGGDIRSLYLLDYPVSTEPDAAPFQLMNDQLPNLFVAQSGLYSAEHKAPSHLADFASEQTDYRLTEGQDRLDVTLTWKDETGIGVEKIYTFHRGSYVVDLTHKVTNNSSSQWNGREYQQFQRSPPTGDGDSRFIHTYTGSAIYSPEEKYEKISFDDMQSEKLSRNITGGWAAMLQHYFLGAWIPPAQDTDNYFSRVLPQSRYVIGSFSPPIELQPEQSYEFASRMFVGPKLQDQLADVAPGLELTVDYGWLTVLSQPLFWLLNKLHSFLNNWGWAIIFLTLLIKLAFFKLSETSYKSMANMRRVGPRIQALKDRYGDDKQRMNQAMMEMYKKEKINPLGGCLPILVQIPVFIALYWVLVESVELRHAPFILWINNLSAPDPYYVLPLLMGVSMYIQQKLNPAPPDPMQAKIMMSLPFVFTIFFAFFPAGLVLYWVANNILSIGQQWYITRQIENKAK